MGSTAGEKTEQPTEKRLREARKRGRVARSQDLTSALLLIGAAVVVWLIGGYLGGILQTFFKEQIEFAATFKGQFSDETAKTVLWRGASGMFWVLTPVFVVVTVFALLGNFLQTGTIFSFARVTPRFEKLNPTDRFRQIFLNSRSYIELAKTIFKVLLTGLIAAFLLWSSREDIARLTAKPLAVTAAFTFNLILELVFTIGLALLIFGAADYFLQRFLLRREMRMTRREVREEYRESEGNPLIKAQRRARYREILSQSLTSVRDADVVLTDAENIAVALKYERGNSNAPRLTAKGADLVAAKIRLLAAEAGVPVKEDASLARSLYQLEIGREIPEGLYTEVAVVLEWVYSKAEERAGI